MPSPRDKRKHKKAVARKKKPKKPTSGSSTVVARIAKESAVASSLPLRLCIASPWLEERKQGVVLIARDAPDGAVVGALFVFDLGCMGLRGAATIGPEPVAAFEERLGQMSLSAASQSLEPAVARWILEMAIDGAARLGFAPRREHAALLGIFGDPGLPVDAMLSFGWAGKPLYIEWEDDDAERILTDLERKVGPHGYHYAKLDGGLRIGIAPVDVADADLSTRVLRCTELKYALDLLARYGPFDDERALWSESAQAFEGEELPEFELTQHELQQFVREHRFDDGTTLLDLLLAQDNLTEWDRATLSRWRELRVGVFRVVERAGEWTVIESIAAGVRYQAQSLDLLRPLEVVPEGESLVLHLVRFEDGWLAVELTPMKGKPMVPEQVAAAMAYEFPEILFDDPVLLERAWQLQREEREDFESFFGSCVVRLASGELRSKVDEWAAYRRKRREERVAAGGHPEAAVVLTDIPGLPEDLLDDEEVFVLFGDRWGLQIVSFFDELEALFLDPSLMHDKERRAVLSDYLDLDSIAPLPFEILAERHPEGASAVFAAHTGRADFDWARDGESLLREVKQGWYEALRPATRPMSAEMIEALGRVVQE